MTNGLDQATHVATASPTKSTRDLLWLVARSTAALTGDALFRSLVSELAIALNLMHVFVTECLDFPTTRVRTLAYWSKTGLRDNVEFNLGGFPCEETIRENRVCWIPDHLAQTYPKEAAYGRESYYGLPIVQPETGRVIGHFAFFDDKRMERDVFDDPLFHIFAALAAAELQRRDAEERAREHLHQLAHLSRVGAMNEMASVLAHEINQPLAASLTYTQASLRLLRAAPGAPPEVIEAMQGAAAEADRAGEVVRHLRAFARKGQIQTESADINALIRETLELVSIEARRESILLRLELQDALPPARVDRVQIQQVVLNLVRNAIDAIRAHGSTSREVLVRSALVPKQRIEISVHDTGPGISNKLAGQIFKPFFTTKTAGLGIGLAICNSIVESHGGRLWMDGEDAAGATFRLSFPLGEENLR